MSARSEYQQAQRKYAKLVWETQKTADGEPFSFDRHYYWRIVEKFYWPELERVAVYLNHCDFDESTQGVLHITDYSASGTRHVTVELSELYACERKAKQALLACRKEHVVRHQGYIDQFARELEKER